MQTAPAREQGPQATARAAGDAARYEERIAALEAEVRALRPYKRMAVIDHLTGIFNRRYFDHRLGEETARMRRKGFPFCVALIDLDHFKRINDTHGHKTGDRVLVSFARFLQANLRRVDVICRIGGEEFGVIMPETHITAGLAIVERLLGRLLERPLPVEGGPAVAVSFSCGIVSNGHSLTDTDRLFEVADQALYAAKRSGRSRVMARCF